MNRKETKKYIESQQHKLGMLWSEDIEIWVDILLEYVKVNRNCPCLIADEPCHTDCSCVNEFSSRGCRACPSFGSDEQMKKQANRIVRKVLEND